MESIVSLQTGLLIYPLHKKTIGVRQSFGRERPPSEREKEGDREKESEDGGRERWREEREGESGRERWMEQMTKREVYHILPSDVRLTCTHTHTHVELGGRGGP